MDNVKNTTFLANNGLNRCISKNGISTCTCAYPYHIKIGLNI